MNEHTHLPYAKLHCFIVHNTIIRQYFARTETRMNGGRGNILQSYYLYGCLCNSEEKQQHTRINSIKQSVTYPHNTAHYCHFAKIQCMINVICSICYLHCVKYYYYIELSNIVIVVVEIVLLVKSQLQSNNRAETRWSRAWNYDVFHFPNIWWYDDVVKKRSQNFK